MREFNILTDRLPDSVTVFHTQFPVHTSFRNWVRIWELLENKTADKGKKTAEILKLCYKDTLPPNIISAMLGMMTFLNRGTDFSVSRAEKGKDPLFSFSRDAGIIYAAFRHQYGIDLTKEDLHWYTFCTLLSSLSEENPFRTVLKIRTFDEKDIKDSAQKKKIRALKEKFAVHQAEKREVDVAEQLSGLF